MVVSLIAIWEAFEPWLVFSGEITQVQVGTYSVSGFVSGVGFGSLFSSSASATVWSGGQCSSAASDFWFGLSPLAVGMLNILLVWRAEELVDYHIPTLVLDMCCIILVLVTSLLFVLYTPLVFVIAGQIHGSGGFNGAFLFAKDASIQVGMGSYLSLGSSILSSILYLILHREMGNET